MKANAEIDLSRDDRVWDREGGSEVWAGVSDGMCRERFADGGPGVEPFAPGNPSHPNKV